MSPIMALNQITLVSTEMLELKPTDFSCGRLINSGHEESQKGGELDFFTFFLSIETSPNMMMAE